MSLFGITYATTMFVKNYGNMNPLPSGVVMMASLPIILGFQGLMGFLFFDVNNLHREPLQNQIYDPFERS
jgi:hypothetical protein